MVNKKSVLVVVLGMLVLMVTLLVAVPATSTKPYDPFVDFDDDGRIGLSDLVILAQSYGTNGTPFLAKAGMLYDSGWVNVTGQFENGYTVTHNLNMTTDGLMVDARGRTSTEFNKTYGRTSSAAAFALVQTTDGGYALAGGTDSFGAGYTNSWLVKTDAAGNVQWNKTYEEANTADVRALVQTTDGGYALAGYTYTAGGPGVNNAWLVKTDANGNMQWSKTYGGWDNDWASALVQTTDGGYALAGATHSFGAGSSDFWLVKTDASGNMQWSKTYGGADTDYASALVQTTDGGYALAGFTNSFGAGSSDFWLVKTDASGNMQWSKTYGGTGDDYAWALVQTTDGGYALAGATDSFGAGRDNFWLVKTDANGNMQWNKAYGGTGDDDARALVHTTDGGYALTGYTRSLGASVADFWLVKTDASGNMQWNQTYGGTGDDWASALVQTTDGGYALAGYTYSFGAGNCDFWLVKTGVESGLAWVSPSADTITLYRSATDPYWNFVRVCLWKQKQTP
jgi:hypothetical protein